MTDRPVPSPQPDIPPATPPRGTRSITQEFKAVAKRSTIWAGVMTVAGVGGVIGALIGGYEVFTSKAEAAGQKAAKEILDQRLPGIDAGLQIVTQRHEDLHGDFKAHVKDEAESRRRAERKLDALLRANNVRNPAPTPPLREDPP